MKMTADKPSCLYRYVLNIKFFVVIFVCTVLACGFVYYIQQASKLNNITNHESKSENGRERNPIKNTTASTNWEDNKEIQIFQEYLRIPTVHPNIDFETCIKFLKKQASSLDLPFKIFYPANDKNPVVVMTWEGLEPELPSIMLNSHMDVVPVFEEYWTHPPFAAEIDENGNIFARGTQDVKQNGMQYLGAIRALKRNGTEKLKRTIHVVFVPDEEIGGKLGMGAFVKTVEFKDLNIGFMFDEGPSMYEDKLVAYYAERTRWIIEFVFHGQSGHGSNLMIDSSAEKLSYVVGKLYEMRKAESYKLNVLNYSYENVTTVNLNMLNGGVASNVIPAELHATFDFRLSLTTDLDAFENQLNKWCDEAGGNITIKYILKEPQNVATEISDSNLYWVTLKNSVEEFGVKIIPHVCIGATDARYLRRLNIPALGFSAMVNTPSKPHQHNEYINAKIYLFGIEMYTKIIRIVANLE